MRERPRSIDRPNEDDGLSQDETAPAREARPGEGRDGIESKGVFGTNGSSAGDAE